MLSVVIIKNQESLCFKAVGAIRGIYCYCDLIIFVQLLAVWANIWLLTSRQSFNVFLLWLVGLDMVSADLVDATLLEVEAFHHSLLHKTNQTVFLNSVTHFNIDAYLRYKFIFRRS